jgi:hypothetical protein
MSYRRHTDNNSDACKWFNIEIPATLTIQDTGRRQKKNKKKNTTKDEQ